MTKHSKTEPVARESASIPEDQLSCLRSCFPEAFTEEKVDMEKLRDTLGDIVETSPERYSFTWAGKKDAIRILQTPSRATLIPAEKESVKFDSAQNLFIEGDNLEALKLLYKSYFGRVKMIYIDPPYNTGTDFIYPDDFADPLNTYLSLSGQKDDEGNLLTSNPEKNGRFHSSWLSMMYPRLFLARQFLREDGVIFVSIDDHEVHNLRCVMNEIFGEENFVSSIIWEKVHSRKNSALYFSTSHDYILCYARKKKLTASDSGWSRNLLPRDNTDAYSNPDNDPNGDWKPDPVYANNPYAADYKIKKPNGVELPPPEGQYWRFSENTWNEFVESNAVIWGKGDGYPMVKRYLKDVQDGLVPVTLFERDFAGDNALANSELDQLLGIKRAMDYPKPSLLLKRLLQIGTSKDEKHIVLDFFAGSCPIAHAVHELNQEDDGDRRYVAIQLPEPTKDGSSAKAGGFDTIAEIGKARIKSVLKKMKLNDGVKIFKLSQSNYRSWTGTEEHDPALLAKQMEAFNDPLMEGWKPENVLYEVAIKEGFGLNIQTEHIENVKGQEVHRVTDPDREQSFFLCLDDKLNIDALAPLKLTQDDLFICRDIALDDTAAANLALQCRLKAI